MSVAGLQSQKPRYRWMTPRPDRRRDREGQRERGVLQQLASTMVEFDPRFQIMPGTKAATSPLAAADAFEAAVEKVIAE